MNCVSLLHGWCTKLLTYCFSIHRVGLIYWLLVMQYCADKMRTIDLPCDLFSVSPEQVTYFVTSDLHDHLYKISHWKQCIVGCGTSSCVATPWYRVQILEIVQLHLHGTSATTAIAGHKNPGELTLPLTITPSYYWNKVCLEKNATLFIDCNHWTIAIFDSYH